MKILNRPMFRYGGPIKEGIMDGIKEPRQRYAQAGDVFKQIAEGYQTGPQVSEPLRSNQQPRGDVLQSAAELGIANPYKDNSKMYMPFAKKYVTKKRNPNKNKAVNPPVEKYCDHCNLCICSSHLLNLHAVR